MISKSKNEGQKRKRIGRDSSVRPSLCLPSPKHKTYSYRTWFIQAFTLFIFKALWCIFCACLRFYFKSLATPIEHRFAVGFKKYIGGDVFYFFNVLCWIAYFYKDQSFRSLFIANYSKNYYSIYLYMYILVINLSLKLEKPLIYILIFLCDNQVIFIFS